MSVNSVFTIKYANPKPILARKQLTGIVDFQDVRFSNVKILSICLLLRQERV